MNEQEYKQYLAGLFEEYVRQRIELFHIEQPEEFYEREAALNFRRMKIALGVINYIRYYCVDDSDIYKTLKIDKLRETISSVEKGIVFHNELARVSGFMFLMDRHLANILREMQLEYLPQEDYEVLRGLGNRDPESDIANMIEQFKSRMTTDQRFLLAEALHTLPDQLSNGRHRLRLSRRTRLRLPNQTSLPEGDNEEDDVDNSLGLPDLEGEEDDVDNFSALPDLDRIQQAHKQLSLFTSEDPISELSSNSLRESESLKQHFEKPVSQDQRSPRSAIRPGREWFKALGNAAEGITLSTVNITLALGWWSFQAPPEFQTTGALMSVGIGASKILIAIDEFQNE